MDAVDNIYLLHRGKMGGGVSDIKIENIDELYSGSRSILIRNKKEFGYDGMSFSRLIPMNWKILLNKDENFTFKGSTDIDDKQIQWNFMKGYQMLVYYRKK